MEKMRSMLLATQMLASLAVVAGAAAPAPKSAPRQLERVGGGILLSSGDQMETILHEESELWQLWEARHNETSTTHGGGGGGSGGGGGGGGSGNSGVVVATVVLVLLVAAVGCLVIACWAHFKQPKSKLGDVMRLPATT